MARLEVRLPRGALAIVAAGEREAQAAAELVLAALEAEHATSPREPASLPREPLPIEFQGGRAYFKVSRLRGAARVRWGSKSACGIPLPRVAEYENLSWLRARLFEAPRPLAAGVLRSHGLPALQFLLTEEVAPATTLERFLRDPAAEHHRAAVLDELAREVARMHALRFVHHDLYPRNVLVTPAGGLSRLVFLDAWAGGAGWNARGPAYDLACLFLRGDEEQSDLERERLFARYVAERAAQGRPVPGPEALRARVRRERRALVARLERRPHELGGRALPALEI